MGKNMNWGKMKVTTWKLSIVFLTAFLCSTSMANPAYQFTSSCAMNGAWTSQALAMTAEIRATLKRLEDNADCKGILGILDDVIIPDFNSQVSDRRDSVTNDINSLGAVAATPVAASNPQVLSALLGSVLEKSSWMTPNKSMSDGSQNTINVGMQVLNRLFDTLPSYETCLEGNPNLLGPLLGGAAKMISAYSASGETNMSSLGGVIAKFTNFLRAREYRTVISKLDEAELATSISCLMEATTENYCSAKDAYEFLNYAEEEKNLYELSKENNDKFNPLEGYFILSREVPIISEWIQRVMLGVVPRTNADSTYKVNILENINSFLKLEQFLYGFYQQRATEYEAQSNLESKQNHLFKMIVKLVESMTPRERTADSANFFERSMAEIKMPFYLIGRDVVPQIVAIGNPETGQPPMPWKQFLQNGGKFREEFQNPDALLLTIEGRLNDLARIAKNNASEYFQQRFIVDQQNLVDQSYVSQTISVLEAFHRIKDYLEKLTNRAIHSNENNLEDFGLLASFGKTLSNINKILGSYENQASYMKELKQKILSGELSLEQFSQDQKMQELVLDIIKTVYLEFNVILQRDTYIMNRMRTYVQYDYMYYTRRGDTLSQYQQDLLVVASKNLVDLLSGAYQNNPALIKQDLSSAQTLNLINLRALEEKFRDKMFNIIAHYNLIVEGKGDAFLTKFADAERRRWIDSQNKYHQMLRTFEPMPLDSSRYAQQGVNISDDNYNFDSVTRNGLNHVVVANPIKWIYTTIFNRQRYNRSGRIFERAVMDMDDMYGSIESFKSRICIQTLPFTIYYKYHNLCSGSILYGLNDEEKNLNLYYDQLYQEFLRLDIKPRASIWNGWSGVKKGDEVDLAKKQALDNNICALRNYRRKNHAHWLVQQVASGQK